MLVSINDSDKRVSRRGKRVAFKVTMRSGELIREKWVKNRVFEGQLAKDSDGRWFRIKKVKMVEAPAMTMTTLEIKEDDNVTRTG